MVYGISGVGPRRKTGRVRVEFGSTAWPPQPGSELPVGTSGNPAVALKRPPRGSTGLAYDPAGRELKFALAGTGGSVVVPDGQMA